MVLWMLAWASVLPQNDAKELLTLCLLVFQGHDEVPHTAASAIVVQVLLQGSHEGRMERDRESKMKRRFTN